MFDQKIFHFNTVIIVISFLCSSALAQNYPISDNNRDTIETCSGIFMDSGLETGPYSSDEKYWVTFHASTGERIQFDFITFNLRNEGGDTLKIFDGIDTLSALLGIYTGEGLSFAVESSDSALTFQFTSNGSLENNGWEASISCCPIPNTSVITGSDVEYVSTTGVSYSVINTPGSNYTLIIEGGIQSEGATSNSITVDWGSLAGSATHMNS